MPAMPHMMSYRARNVVTIFCEDSMMIRLCEILLLDRGLWRSPHG
jgi:hypothetical protein